MDLQEALQGISQRRYYEICGYSYRCLKQYNHGELTWEELNPRMKLGILDLINGIYRVQKMVYSYDIDYLTHCMKSCGIQLKPFFERCEFPKSFVVKYCMYARSGERLYRIRLELLRMINHLFDFIFQ